MCAAGSDWERDHLLFRDYLRAHPDAADAYANAKHQAAATWADDRWAYTEARTAIIPDTLEAAQQWAHATTWSLPPLLSSHDHEDFSAISPERRT